MKVLVGVIIAAIAAIFLYDSSRVPTLATHNVANIYEITVPDDWYVLTKEELSKSLEGGIKVVENSAVDLPIPIPRFDTALAFAAQKITGNEELSVRITVGPPSGTKAEFDSLTDEEIADIGEQLREVERQYSAANKINLISTEASKATIRGIPALRTESVFHLPSGSKVSTTRYLIYRSIGVIQVVFDNTIKVLGEPDYRLAEVEILNFKVLAE